jgi:hypothetical protein
MKDIGNCCLFGMEGGGGQEMEGMILKNDRYINIF